MWSWITSGAPWDRSFLSFPLSLLISLSEPPRYTWRSTCMKNVYVISFTWKAFTWSNYCVTHDCVTSMCVKYICMTKVTNTWRNKSMTHINKTRITLTWRHKYMNVTHMTPKNNYMTYDYMTYNYKITVQEIIIYLYLTNSYYCTSSKLWLSHNLGPLRRWDCGRGVDDDNGVGKCIAHRDDSLFDKWYKNHKSEIWMTNGKICQI